MTVTSIVPLGQFLYQHKNQLRMANSNIVTATTKIINHKSCGLHLHPILYIPSNFTNMPITTRDTDSVSPSRPGSPTNHVKFLCSHGGKILPRPPDRHLKYVGGETRVISVLRHITFSELMKKLTSMFNGEMILKYQLIPEDLDVLVTVKSDEDIRHMIEECDRHEYLGAPRLRAFLFPAQPIVVVNRLGLMDHHSLEQRYINSVNGIVVHPPPPITNTFRPFSNSSYTTFSVSSACSSPTTPPETTSTATTTTTTTSCHGKHGSLTRNHTSPSLCNLGCSSVTNSLNPIATTQSQHQQPPQPAQSHLQPHLSPKPPLDRLPHRSSGPEHVGRMRSTGVGEYYRQQTYQSPSHSHRAVRGGHMYYQRGSPYDDYYGSCRYDRTDSPPSPDVPSSSHSSRSGR